ncbi:MAG: hypothetical protein WC530_00435 [Candidatus Omnitrophota bacterium]|jgi:hypothetical protein
MNSLTTPEAANKYGLSTGYIRHLLINKVIKGRQAILSRKNTVWLIDEPSLKKYLAKDRTPGPKPRKKRPKKSP